MKRNVLFAMVLLVGTFTSAIASSPLVDPATYSTRFGYNLTSQWAYTNVLGNYVNSADLLGAATTVRGMTVKDGKMLFCSRNSVNQILVIDGTTGAKLTPVTLASNVFTYLGRNKANTADSTWTVGYPCNDIHVDNAGNVLVGNMITSNTGRFQIWKIDLTTGNGTIVVDQKDIISDFSTSKAGTRFDAFGVWGDVTKDAVIMAVNAEATVLEAYKWTISNGVAGKPVLVEIDNSGQYFMQAQDPATKLFTPLANAGSAPRVLPLDMDYFYLDGNTTYPTLVDKEGNIMDGFFKIYDNAGNVTNSRAYSALTDSITLPGTKWVMNQGHNGVKEFQIGNDNFLIMSATNTATKPFSSFRIFKFADANKLFSGLDVMWTFPQAGMGAAQNTYRTGMPAVEVNGTSAKIYVYTGENGYAMYTMSVATGVKNVNVSNVSISLNKNKNRIIISEMVKSVEIYAVNGQRISFAHEVSEIAAPSQKGIYLVNVLDKSNATKVEKIVVY